MYYSIKMNSRMWTWMLNVLFHMVVLLVLVTETTANRNCSIDVTGLPSDTCTFDLRMRNAQPFKADEYFCTAYNVAEDIMGQAAGDTIDGYIVKYEALADAGTAHHILVFGCQNIKHKVGDIWHCGQVCSDESNIIFAWAKNAPPLSLPKDVGQHIGHGTKIDYIVIQIHYVMPLPTPDVSGIRIYTTQQRQKYIAGIYLMLAYNVPIPARTETVHIDSSCRFNWGDSIVPIGFRTHAHTLGKVISGYKVHNGEYQLIGKGNPQWPQAFYPVEENVSINRGDILAARCTFDSSERDRTTKIGETANDEMCNFYIMYYMNATMENQRGKDVCANIQVPSVFRNIPADSDTPLPYNPLLEEQAKGHHHHVMTGNIDDDSQPNPATTGPPTDVFTNNFPNGNAGNNQKQGGVKLDPALGLTFLSEVDTVQIGQVGGLAVNKAGELYIFHRGENIWSSLSFDQNDVYTLPNRPIESDTIVILNKNMTVKRSFGKNRFFLPHGLALDSKGNMWLTDVALHQVFRIPAGGDKPDMTLGIMFEPGSDSEHFCKPADVAVLASGEFFVADGYCNSRIMKFDQNGYFISQFGSQSYTRGADGFPPPATFILPHGLALAEDKGQLCVADRENGRIQCFDLQGRFIRQIHPPQFGRALYAIEYCPNHGGLLFAVNGPSLGAGSPDTQGLTIDINTGDLVSIWNIKKGLTHPHDVAVDSANHMVYVGELNPSKVWKLQMDSALYDKAGKPSVTQQPPPTKEKVKPKTNAPTPVVKSKTDVINDVTNDITDDLNAKGHNTISDKATKKLIDTSEDDMGPSLIIGALLVIPVLLLIIITVLVRLYHTGRFSQCCRRNGRKPIFNIGNFLNSHKGFDRLSTEDDDHDIDNALDDSDNEEFSIARKA